MHIYVQMIRQHYMLLRTEELKRVPSYRFKIRSQSQSPQEKLFPLIPLFQTSSTGSDQTEISTESTSAMHQRQPTAVDCELGSAAFLTQVSIILHCVTFYLKREGVMRHDSLRFHVDVHVDTLTKATEHLSSYSNTGHEHSGEDSFLLFLCQMKHRAPP